MTKKTRTFLFLACALAFFFLSPAVVLYSQGYRLDWKNRRLTTTGAVFIKAFPKTSQVFVDQKLVKTTDFLFGSALLDNLLPGRHEIQVRKDGFFPWKKNLEIDPSQVAEAKNIVLFPATASFQKLSQEALDIFPDPNLRQAVLKKSNSRGWYLTLLDLSSGLEKVLLQETDLTRLAPKQGADLLNLEWAAKSQRLILTIGRQEQPSFFLLDLSQNPVLPVSLDYLASSAAPQFDASNADNLFFFRDDELWRQNLGKGNPVLLAKNVLAFAVANDKIYLLNTGGGLMSLDAPFDGQPIQVSERNLDLAPETENRLSFVKNNLWLQSGDRLLLFDLDRHAWQEVSPDSLGFGVAPNGSTAFFYNKAEIWVIYLKDSLEQPVHRALDKVLLVRFAEKINQVFWLDSYHLVFGVGDKIKTLESDERDEPNLVDLSTAVDPRFWLNSGNKKNRLLLWSQGSISLLDLSPILP